MNPKKTSVFLFIGLAVSTITVSCPGYLFSLPPSGVDHPDISRLHYDLSDSVESRRIREPREMTPDMHEKLDNLEFPKPSGLFAMDGKLDTSAVLLDSTGRMHLYAAVRGSQLYVATNSARSQGADMFVFVSVAVGEMRDAPMRKTGRVGLWSAFLENRRSDTTANWYDVSASILTNIVDEKVGTVLEGVVDIEYLTGISPKVVYLAVGKYKTGDRGKLLQQVPAGNANGNIDPAEFYQLKMDQAHED
jgi:hypothetical protein